MQQNSNNLSARTLLAPDDLNVGQVLTIHSIIDQKKPVSELRDAEDNLMGIQYSITSFRSDLAGFPLVVKSINLPFLIVEKKDSGQPFTLDIRSVNLMRLSEEYVREATKNAKKQQESYFASFMDMRKEDKDSFGGPGGPYKK
jgi:hypothetical protein